MLNKRTCHILTSGIKMMAGLNERSIAMRLYELVDIFQEKQIARVLKH
jgi:hypothetical protein